MSQAPAAEPHSRTETAETAEMSAEELLAIPPQADHLAEELAARPVRAKLPRVTLVLGGAILVAAGFIGGTLAQKHYGTSSGGTAARAASFASTFTRGTGTGGAGRTGTGTGGFGGGSGFGGGAGGSSISGTVTVVSGDTLYVTATNGTVYTVKTSGTTTVSISSSGTLSQLKPGQTVTIAGSADSSGDVTATSITAATN
ncbi:hypothetical protein KDL01_03555 [Actinospica durhamensis]|uniref:DUF5666 domain-containing protein n=1 Tax=Actinospica durhamensis TaxID=1508375 RepID=A0A941INR2_9ACTN|nr:DUF5666 domain-containing protein [Actinospica durhamensis]MBR7832317.1 hypothetical protein [Actinospica durhamensis]